MDTIQSNEENLRTSMDTDERLSVMPSFSSSTPNTRRSPRQMDSFEDRTVEEAKNLNSDGTQAVDDTFDMSVMEKEINCRGGHGVVAAHHGDVNIEDNYLEGTLISEGGACAESCSQGSFTSRTLDETMSTASLKAHLAPITTVAQCLCLKPTDGDILGSVSVEKSYLGHEVGNAADEDTSASYEKVGFERLDQEERCAAGMETVGVQFGNDNIEASFLEKPMAQCGAGLLEQSLYGKTDPFSDQFYLRLPINQPVTQGGHMRRIVDSNREDTAVEATLCEMDFTQGNISVNPFWREMLEMNDGVVNEGLPQSTQAIRSSLEDMLPDVTTQQATEITQQATPQKTSPKPDSVGVTVEAVVMCERYDTHKKLKKVPSLAKEMEILGIRLDENVNTEIMGTVNVSALSDGSERHDKEYPCVSRRPSNFSISAAMKKTAEGVEFMGDSELPVDVDIYENVDQAELIYRDLGKRPNVGDADETTMFFHEFKHGPVPAEVVERGLVCGECHIEVEEPAVKNDGSAQNVDDTITIACDINIAPATDDTSAAVDVSTRFAGDLPEVFPARILAAEAEGRTFSSKNVITRSATEANLDQIARDSEGSPSDLIEKIEKSDFNTSDGDAISFRMKSITLIPKVVAMDDIEEMEEGEYLDTDADEMQGLDESHMKAHESRFERQCLLGANANSSTRECVDPPLLEASKRLSQQRKYNMNDFEFSFITEETKAYERADQGCMTDVEQLRKKLSDMEMQMAELHSALRAVSADRDVYEEKSSANDVVLAETNKKLGDMMKARELAEKMVTDYNYAVEKHKGTEVMQMQDLQTKMLIQKGELEKSHAQIQAQMEKKSEALPAANEKSTEELIGLQKQLTETAQILEKYEVEVAALQDKLKEADDDKALLREMQLTSELELIKTKDEMEESRKTLKEITEAYAKAQHQYSMLEKDMHVMRSQLDEKNRLHEIDRLAVEELKTACALAKEQVCSEKAASDSAKIEIAQLLSDKAAVKEALVFARAALAEAERRAAAAEKDLSDHIKCHTEELNKRVTDLEFAVNNSLAEKTSLEKGLSEQLQKQSVLLEELQRTTELVSVLETELADAKVKHTEEVKRLARSYGEKVVGVEKDAIDFAEIQSYVKSLEDERERLKEELALASKRLDEGDVILREYETWKAEKNAIIAQCDSLKKDLVAAEEVKVILGRDLEELRLGATQSDAEIATLRNAKASLVKEWQEKEEDYKEKLREAEKRMTVIPELESSIKLLKTEASVLGQELTVANSKLHAAVESKEETRNALTALEQQYITLQLSKKIAEKEYEESKKHFEARLAVAQKTADELTEEVARLEDLISVEQNAAKQKVSAMYAEVYRLERELEEMKIARTEIEMKLSKESSKYNELEDVNKRLEAKVADALASPSPEQEKELCELKRLVEIKEKEIDRLGNLCDEFDEIEADYREKIFALCRERDALKLLINSSSLKEEPNLKPVLYEGVKMPTTECAIQNENEVKLKELLEMVKELGEEKSRIEKSRTLASVECEELKRHCKIQERRIEELEKICDEADECEVKLKRKIAELEKEVAGEKEDAYLPVPSSPDYGERLHSKPDAPMLEESLVEDSAAPNRTLHATIQSRLNKTRKLTETIEKTKEANTSRCAQQ